MGDSARGCAAVKSALKHEKGVQPSICKVYLINWSLSLVRRRKENRRYRKVQRMDVCAVGGGGCLL